jgi:hypothetical protein
MMGFIKMVVIAGLDPAIQHRCFRASDADVRTQVLGMTVATEVRDTWLRQA